MSTSRLEAGGHQRGFTLIELLVGLALAVLLAVAVVRPPSQYVLEC
jgi:prepilin-type N-terminal cleavage/methylation domain-containing protein